MRGGGIIIVIILGIVLGFRALYRLYKMSNYLRFTLYLLFWFGYPFLAYNLYLYIQQQENEHIRMWLLMPVMLSSLIWLFFGLMMNKKVENIQNNINYMDKFSRRRRILGLIISTIALSAWIGGFNSYFGESDGVDILGSFILSLVFWIGILYLSTGKPFRKIDS
ncbi:hypothetical protein [Paenibacillus gansuensis]|uniref:Uncharacterized protein n=1 Tax=Paenibacillus gansuensis TaxID=306542 RepID=A0ABW5PJI9_9BACL